MRKRVPVLKDGKVLRDENGNVLEFWAVNQDELDNKIDKPQTAAVGEVLTVEEVDAEGKPKKWKTQTVETEPPDWNENDPTKPGYIENRTHYKCSERFIGIVTFTVISDSEKILAVADEEQSKAISSLIGSSYNLKIIIDGKVCTSIAYNSHSVDIIQGQFNWAVNGPAGYTSRASIDNDDVTLVLGQTYEVQFYNIGTYYKTIPEEYFPTTIFSQNNAPVKFGTNDDESINYTSSVQGYSTKASGDYSHAEGSSTKANGDGSHAEGYATQASGRYSHAEGYSTRASGNYSHADGEYTVTSIRGQHVLGRYNLEEDRYRKEIYTNSTKRISAYSTKIYRSNAWTFDANTGLYSLVDPEECSYSDITTNMYYIVNSVNSSVSMDYLISIKSTNSNSKTYNCILYSRIDQMYQYGAYAHVVGNGTSDNKRSNAHTLDWEGNAWFSGNVYVGSTSGTNKDEGSVRLATMSDLSFPITITSSTTDGVTTYTADKTFEEIKAAYENGANVYAVDSIESDIFHLIGMSRIDAVYRSFDFYSIKNASKLGILISINNDNVISVYKYNLLTSENIKNYSVRIWETLADVYHSGNNCYGICKQKGDVSSTYIPDNVVFPVIIYVDTYSHGEAAMRVIDANGVVWIGKFDYGTPKLFTAYPKLPSPTTAQVGQIVKVKAVDAGGKITETETVDMPSEEKWELIKTIDVADGTAETTALTIDTDNNGNAFSLKKCRLFARFPAYKGETTIPNFSFAMINKGMTGDKSPLCYTSGFPKLRTDGYSGTVWEVDVSGLQQYEKVMRTSSTTWSANVYGSINSQTTEYWGDKRIQSITSIGGAQMIIFPGCHFELHGVRE